MPNLARRKLHCKEVLAEHARTLDTAYREVAGRLVVNTEVRVDDTGKIHLSGVKAVEEPPSLVDLRRRELWVEVSASPWAQELQFLKPKLLAALDRALGPGKVKDLRVRVGTGSE